MTWFSARSRWWMTPLSSGASTLSASFAAGCVGPLVPLGDVISAMALDWLHWLDIQMPILYGVTGLTLAGLSLGVWKHRRPWPLLPGVTGMAGILYPFHDALDVTVFRMLLYGGAASLLLASAWDFVLIGNSRVLRHGAKHG